jgi:hypothetical protein
MSQDDAGGLGGRLSDGPDFGGGEPPIYPKCDPVGDPGFNGGLFDPVDVPRYLAVPVGDAVPHGATAQLM